MGFLRGRLGSQIGRFLRGKIISYFRQQLAFFDTLKDKFLGGGGGGGGGGGVWVPQSYYATIQWNCHCIKRNNLWPSHIGIGIKEH